MTEQPTTQAGDTAADLETTPAVETQPEGAVDAQVEAAAETADAAEPVEVVEVEAVAAEVVEAAAAAEAEVVEAEAVEAPAAVEPVAVEPVAVEPVAAEAQAVEPAKPSPAAPRPPALRMPSPAVIAAKPPAPVKPILPTLTPADEATVEASKAFGRVDAEAGVVYLVGDPEVEVGKVADCHGEDPLEHFAKKYVEVLHQINEVDTLLAQDPPPVRDIRRSVDKSANALSHPHFIGDIEALRARAHEQQLQARHLISEVDRARKVEKQQAAEAREVTVAAAEHLSEADAQSINWRQASEQFRELLDTWKQQQANDIKLDKPVEDALWKRFSHARATFERRRKQFFAALDANHAEAKQVKEKLIAEAEALSTSTDWIDTTSKFRNLMDTWRSAPRASRKEDDALWARFKAAQDTFFDAKNAEASVAEEEFRGNLEVKEALLAEAKALLPVKDLAAAKATLRTIQDRWEEAGKVPRADIRRMEDGLRSVERALKDAEAEEWRRSNPETQARTSGFRAQLEDLIADLEKQLAAAQSAGKDKQAKEIEANLEMRRSWLATLD
ncbi:DUF349 domain-containing protein [Micrococcales bacterium 31B]|nr:DUF349 domain-containing protein [Micrococcales bacterium 31B]